MDESSINSDRYCLNHQFRQYDRYYIFRPANQNLNDELKVKFKICEGPHRMLMQADTFQRMNDHFDFRQCENAILETVMENFFQI